MAVFVCAAFLCGTAGAADDPYASLLAPGATCGPASDQLNLDQQTAQTVMLCFTNYARTQSGLTPLTLNSTLNDAGHAKLAADISCGVFSHEPCGQPFESVFATYTQGATSYSIGENIAWGTGSYGTPRSIMDAWLNSTGHRENILTPSFAELGVGYLANQTFQGHGDATLWSQEFGVRTPSSAPSPAPAGSQPQQTSPQQTSPQQQVPARKKPAHKKHVRPHRRASR
jgi:uncharacterized protein YkwD